MIRLRNTTIGLNHLFKIIKATCQDHNEQQKNKAISAPNER